MLLCVLIGAESQSINNSDRNTLPALVRVERILRLSASRSSHSRQTAGMMPQGQSRGQAVDVCPCCRHEIFVYVSTSGLGRTVRKATRLQT